MQAILLCLSLAISVTNMQPCSPVRRLCGITYWVIDDPEGIYDFVNNEVQTEWEADTRFECRKPAEDHWLRTLSKRRWSLEVAGMGRIKLNARIMNYVDDERGYVFSEELAKRSDELRRSIEEYRTVIWPIIVRSEDFMLFDGYCRYTALRMMNVQRLYVYVGTM